ncbi:chemotaxis-specific methylesterase [marine gamma proteobacterium HTCC2143]|uniref:Protein-glutamate methylesterase/protein-glutamine glutaminase n=1 Tax=marine gamma proteobacterium HTCC2143 TaxID=247633 RepID=A0YC76_9GAMM|nr:chemotaxis-specific methylesterase [marine gamma proteobacterium HTCC2143]
MFVTAVVLLEVFMTISVLIVDDSAFFRRRLVEMLSESASLDVIGTAVNGQEAVEKTLMLKPDVVTMDYEMPVMNGITTIKRIMAQCPTPILMFSSLTYEGARITLEAGAVDYLPKSFDEISTKYAELSDKLIERIRAVAGAGIAARSPPLAFADSAQIPKLASRVTLNPPAAGGMRRGARLNSRNINEIAVVVIAASTGGPVALQRILSQLPANFPKPLVLVQHMPAVFTPALAERLNKLCDVDVREAENGDTLQKGLALQARGGRQLMVGKDGKVKILLGDERMNYKPSADITLGSAANVFGSKVLAIVLTGMGADGCEGAKILKQKGALIWAQDEDTSLIYGMPMAVTKAELVDEVLSLDRVG